MANPPSNNDLQRERAKFLNRSLSLSNIIKQGSIANSSRDNVQPILTPSLPVSLTPTPSITPTVQPTETPSNTPTRTPTPSVTPISQGLLVNTTNQFTSFGATSAIYNSYFYKIVNPFENYPFIDYSVNTGYLDVNNNSIIFYDNVNFSGWTIFNLNLYTAVCSASLSFNYLIPFSGWIGLSNDGDISNFTNFSITNVPVASPTPTITITPSITPTVTPTISNTPTLTPTTTITPSITPTITLMPPALVVTTVSGISANFFNYLGLSGRYLRQGFVYPGYFYKQSNTLDSYCDLNWYEKNDLFTNSPPGYLFLAQYASEEGSFDVRFWGVAFSEYPSNSAYPPGPLNRDLPPSGRYFSLSSNDQGYVIDYLLNDPTMCLDVAYDFTPLTPTPTPSVTPTITLTPSITPTLTPTISITPSNTPTISITPSITPTITVTISLTPTQAPTTTIYVSGNASFFANFTNIPGTSAFVMFTDGSIFNGKPVYQYVGLYEDIIQMYWSYGNYWVLAYQGSFFLTNNTNSYYPPFKETYADANGWALFPANSATFGANSETISSLRITNYLLFPTPTPTPSLTPGYYVETYFKSFSIPLTFTNNNTSLSIDQFGSNNPSFTAFRFRNYDLITNSLSSDLHLALRVSSNNISTQVTGTFNNNIVTGISGGVIMFTPDDYTPNDIIYQCTNNPSISGTIFVRYPNLVLPTPTPTASITPTVTPTISFTPTQTPTITQTPSITPSSTLPAGLIDATTTQYISVINVTALGITLTALKLGLYEGSLIPTGGYVNNILDDCFIDYFDAGISFDNGVTPVSGWYIYQERPYLSSNFFLRCYQPALSSGTNFVPATTGWIYLTGAGQQGDQSLYNKLKIVKGSWTP